MVYTDKIKWQKAVIKTHKSLTVRKTRNNILLYSNGKLVATYNLIQNIGTIL